jgi:alkylhydroperoxidase family enzyme
LGAGGSESLYDQIEAYETASDLTERHKAALRYADAMIWSPATIKPDVAAGVRAHYTDTEAFELTVDVMRNAANKIMVALGADAPKVQEGTERFLVDEDGRTVFG